MNDRNKIITLSAVAGVLLITLFLGKAVFPQNKGIKTIETALLNSKYISEIEKIKIETSFSNLDLCNENQEWIGKSEGMSFPIEKETLEEFLSLLLKIRDVSIVASKDDKSTFGFDEKSFIKVNILGNEDKSFTDIIFGSENYNGRKIYFRTSDNENVYQMENDIASFLTPVAKWWGNVEVFPDEFIPSKPEDIIEIETLFSDDKSKNYKLALSRSSEWEFTQDDISSIVDRETAFSYIKNIKAARASQIVPTKTLRTKEEETVIQIKDKANIPYKVSFFKQDELYYAYYDNGKYSYCLEMSGWTFDKLTQPQLGTND